MVELDVLGITSDRRALEIDQPQFAAPFAGKGLIAQVRDQILVAAERIDQGVADERISCHCGEHPLKGVGLEFEQPPHDFGLEREGTAAILSDQAFRNEKRQRRQDCGGGRGEPTHDQRHANAQARMGATAQVLQEDPHEPVAFGLPAPA